MYFKSVWYYLLKRRLFSQISWITLLSSFSSSTPWDMKRNTFSLFAILNLKSKHFFFTVGSWSFCAISRGILLVTLNDPRVCFMARVEMARTPAWGLCWKHSMHSWFHANINNNNNKTHHKKWTQSRVWCYTMDYLFMFWMVGQEPVLVIFSVFLIFYNY